MNEKIFNTGELQLAYLENDSSNPPLVLLHGLTGWRSDWNNLLPLLTPDWHVYLVELRGHGNSGRGASYGLADYDRDIIAFLRSLNEPVVLIGFSLGALVALTVAAQSPELLRDLVLIDPPLFAGTAPMTPRAGDDYFQWVYATVSASPSYEEVVEQVKQRLPAGTGEPIIKAMADQISRVAPGTVGDAIAGRLWGRDELVAALQHITMPTLFIHGEASAGAAMSDEAAEFVREHLPAATIFKIPNTGHLIPMEHPRIVVQQLNEFLASR